MGATYVQEASTDYGTYYDGSTWSFGSDVTAGNHIAVLMFHSYSGCPPSLSDNQGNSYTARGANPGTPVGLFRIFTAPVGSTGPCTITMHCACGYVRLFVAVEVSGLDDADLFEAQNTATDASSTYETGSITPASDGAFLIAMWHKAGGTLSGTSVSSEVTIRQNYNAMLYATGTQAIAAAVNPQLTGPTGTIYGCVAAFNASAVAAPEFLPLFGQPIPRRMAPLLRR